MWIRICPWWSRSTGLTGYINEAELNWRQGDKEVIVVIRLYGIFG